MCKIWTHLEGYSRDLGGSILAELAQLTLQLVALLGDYDLENWQRKLRL